MLTNPHTKIIAAFPGTGKSFYHNNNKETSLDSDSSNFSWIYVNNQKVRNPDFPNNYINHIKENIGKYNYIFVSSHKEVRQALIQNFLFFYLLFPTIDAKECYIQRYINRNSDKSFIELIENNWESWIEDCLNQNNCATFPMMNNWTITNMIESNLI